MYIVYFNTSGSSKKYYKTGELKMSTPYVNGVKDGILNTYYKSGNIRYEVLFKNGFPIGSSKYFYETGEVKIESFYNNLGKLEGFPQNIIKMER